MTDIKPWWQSKTLLGAMITLASALLGLLGYEFGEADREALTGLLTSLGGIVAIIGRFKAKNRIG